MYEYSTYVICFVCADVVLLVTVCLVCADVVLLVTVCLVCADGVLLVTVCLVCADGVLLVTVWVTLAIVVISVLLVAMVMGLVCTLIYYRRHKEIKAKVCVCVMCGGYV